MPKAKRDRVASSSSTVSQKDNSSFINRASTPRIEDRTDKSIPLSTMLHYSLQMRYTVS